MSTVSLGFADEVVKTATYVWDPNTLSWVPYTPSASGGGGGGDVNVTNSSLNVVVTNPVNAVTVTNFPGTQAVTNADLATIASAVKLEDTAAVTGDAGMPMLALRQSVDTVSTSDDGDYANLKTDEEGRLKVSTKPASYTDITGSITAIQAAIGTPIAGGTVAGDVSRASNAMAFCSGTFAGVNCTFEGSLEASGDTNWFGIQAVRTNANTIETATGALSAQPVYAWEMSVNGLARMRVRATARTSGTQNWRFKLGTYATEPIPAAQASATQAVSGTVSATATPITPTTTFINSAATNNATLIKASAGTVWSVVLNNVAASTRYVKLSNLATLPVPGTTVPVQIYAVPPGAPVVIHGGSNGIRFSAGIGLWIVANAPNNDNTVVAVDDVKVAITFT